jgi:hypothetical protein
LKKKFLKFKQKIKENSIFLGIKKGISISILPPKINKIYNSILFRIFRVVGGISLLLVISHKYLILPDLFHKPILYLGLLQSIQMIFFFIIKLIYGIYTLIFRAKEFEVRNSPLNLLATTLARIIYCAKIGCAITGGAATLLGAGLAHDEILVAAGFNPQFKPFMSDLYKSVYNSSIMDFYKFKTVDVSPSQEEQASVLTALKEFNKLDEAEKKFFLDQINANVNEIAKQNKK